MPNKFIRTILKILLGISLFIGFAFIFFYFYVDDILLLTVPSNKTLSIPKEEPIEQIIPRNLGGENYEEVTVNSTHPNSMNFCVEGVTPFTNESTYNYLCKNFSRGYLRKYHSYILNNQELKGVKENYAAVVYILEFQSPRDVKNAASYYTLEVVVPKFSINRIKVMGTNTKYIIPLPYSNKLITLKGNPLAIENVTRQIVEKYK